MWARGVAKGVANVGEPEQAAGALTAEIGRKLYESTKTTAAESFRSAELKVNKPFP